MIRHLKVETARTDEKVKGTIQWVSAAQAVPAEIRLYENIVDEEKECIMRTEV